MLQKLRELLTLTPEGAIFVLANGGLLAMGLYKGINLISLLTCSLLCLGGLNIFLAGRQLRGLHGRRLLYEPAFANTPFVYHVELHNSSSRRRTGIMVSDPAIEGNARWFVDEIEPRERIDLTRELVFTRRGSIMRGPLTAASGFPFGFALRRLLLVDKEPFLVLPRVASLQPGVMRQLLSAMVTQVGEESATPVRHASAQSEIHSLREYRPGDSPRWIHWRTSARRDELFVREYEDIPTEQLTLLVDPWLSGETTQAAAGALLEDTIALAASIAWEWCRQTGNPFHFVIAGRNPDVISGVTNRAFALRILERMAVESGYTHADHQSLIDRLAAQRLTRGRILAICTREGELMQRLRNDLRVPVTCISVADEPISAFING